MSNNEFEGWENLMGPEQRAGYEQAQLEQDAYQRGYRAGYEEGERDGYNRAQAELEASNATHNTPKREGKRPTLTIKDSEGSAGSSEA